MSRIPNDKRSYRYIETAGVTPLPEFEARVDCQALVFDGEHNQVCPRKAKVMRDGARLCEPHGNKTVVTVYTDVAGLWP